MADGLNLKIAGQKCQPTPEGGRRLGKIYEATLSRIFGAAICGESFTHKLPRDAVSPDIGLSGRI